MSVLPRRAVCIFGALRSPLADLSSVRPDVLLSRLLRALLDRNLGASAAASSFFLGCAHPEGYMGWNLTRQALWLADLSEISGSVVSSLSLSGLDAFLAATGNVLLQGSLSVAGAISQPSRVPYGGFAPEQALSYELMSRQATWPRELARQEVLANLVISSDEQAAYLARVSAGQTSLFSPEDLPVESIREFSQPTANVDGAALVLLGTENSLRQRPWACVRGVARAAGAARNAPQRMIEAVAVLLRAHNLRPSQVDCWAVDDIDPRLPLWFAAQLSLPFSSMLAHGSAQCFGSAGPIDSLRHLAEASFLLSRGEFGRAVVTSWSEGGQAIAILLEPM